MKFFIYLGIFAFLTEHSLAQNINKVNEFNISGLITNAENQPIDFAQIIIKDQVKRVIAYSYTDSIGNYFLKYQTLSDSITLDVSRIGYIEKSIRLSTKTATMNLTLNLSPNNRLTEVVITNNINAINSKNDTITFLSKAFSDGTETNVEDLLTKLPGLSVNKDTGKIKFQGREIKTILLDGDDLTGQNYKVLSKNLSADWIQEIEILKKFTNSRLLKGLIKSEDIAINLKLKENAKAPLFGNLLVGGGTTSKHTIKAELLSYLKNLKRFSVIVGNNTGSDLETYDMETYSNSQLEYKGFLFAEQILNESPLAPPFFKNENFTFQEGQFVSNVMVVKPTHKFNIRSFTSLYNNNLNFNSNDSLSYILPNNKNLSIIQSQILNQKPFEAFQDLKLDYTLSKNEELTSAIKFKYSDKQFRSVNETNYDSIRQKEAIIDQQFYGNISYTNKLNSMWVLVADFQIGRSHLDEHLNFYDFLKNIISANNQTINQNYFNLGGMANLIGKINETFYGNLLLGWAKTSSDFGVSKLYSNKYEYKNTFIEFNLKADFKNIHFNTGARFRSINTIYNFQKYNNFLIEPQISVSLKKRILKYFTSEFKGIYNSEYVFFKPSSLFDKELSTSFRSKIYYNTSAHIPTKNDFLIFSVNISDNEKNYLTTHFEWGYETNNNTLSNSIFYNNDIVINEFIQNSNSNSLFTIYSIDKYFQKIHTSIKLSYKNQISNSVLSIENISGSNRLRRDNFNIAAGLILTKKINLSLAFNNYNDETNWLSRKTKFDFQNYWFKIIYNYSKAIMFNLAFQTTDFGKNLGGVNSIVETNIKFKPKNGKWQFEGQLNNLTNLNLVKISKLNPFFFTTTNYPLQPRFLLLTAKYRF